MDAFSKNTGILIYLKAFLLSSIFILSNTSYGQSNVIYLKDSTKFYPINGKKTLVLEDKNKSITIEDVRTKKCQKQFKLHNANSLNFGLSNSNYWLKIEVAVNQSDNEWILKTNNIFIDSITVYQYHKKKLINKFTTGYRFNFSTRPIIAKTFAFPIKFLKNKKQTIYVHIAGNFLKNIPLQIIEKSKFEWDNFYGNFFIVAVLATLFTITVYNILLYIALREKSFLYFVLVNSSFLTWLSLHTGFIFYIFPFLNFFNIIFDDILALLTTFLFLKFAAQILKLEKHFVKINRLINKLSIPVTIFIIIGILSPFMLKGSYSFIMLFSNTITIGIIYFSLYLGIVSIKKKHPPYLAKFYIICRSIVVCAVTLLVFKEAGLWNDNFIIQSFYQSAFIFETIILSIGLIEKINAQKKENNKILEEAKSALEETLINRTEIIQKQKLVMKKNQIKLEKTLAQSLSINQAIDNSAIVTTTDLKGNILKTNDIFLKISKYTIEEIVGKNQNIVNSGYHSHKFWKEMWKTIGKGKTWRAEIRNKAKDGSIYWVDTVINPIRDENGKIFRYLSVRYLITDRKNTEKALIEQHHKILLKNQKIEKTIKLLGKISKSEALMLGNWKIISHDCAVASVDALNLDACELWYFNYKEDLMYCIANHHKSNRDKSPNLLTSADFPLLFSTYKEKNTFVAENIEYESLTPADISYLNRYDYCSIAIHPIELSEKQTGVIVFYIKKPYRWENEDMIFFKSIHDELSLTYHAYRREQAKKKIQEQNERIQDIYDSLNASIDYAKNIQNAILASIKDIKKDLPNSFIFFKPKDVVSGDFYFYTKVGYKSVIAAVDCTGHGIPGAFMSLISNDLLHEIINAKGITEPDRILNALRSEIIRVLRQKETGNLDGMDIAICCTEKYPVELQEHLGLPTLKYAGARNPLFIIQEGKLEVVKGDRIIIGGTEFQETDELFQNHVFSLHVDTYFYIFSDGIQDQFGGPKKKKYSQKRLKNFLFENHEKTMKEQHFLLSQEIEKWQEQTYDMQIDDMLLIGVKVEV